MYIPLFPQPQRREQSISIWGPPADSHNQNQDQVVQNRNTVSVSESEDSSVSCPQWPSSSLPGTYAPFCKVVDVTYSTNWRHKRENPVFWETQRRFNEVFPITGQNDFVPCTSPREGDEKNQHDAATVEDSTVSRSFPEYTDRMAKVHQIAVAQLLRSLDLTTPSPQFEGPVDASILTPSSASSPLQSLPTPPDNSPTQTNKGCLPASQSFFQLSNTNCPVNLLSKHHLKESDSVNYGLPAPASLGGLSRASDSARFMGTTLSPTFYALSGLPGLVNAELPGQSIVPEAHSGKAPQPMISKTQSVIPLSGDRSIWHLAQSQSSAPTVAGDAISGPSRVQSFVSCSEKRAIENQLTDQFRFSYPNPLNDTIGTESVNFLHLLEPASSPQYSVFVQRIIAHSDQQASIFLQQKLKASGNIPQERMKIVDAICSKGFEMMCNRFGNWAVQRCLDSDLTPEEKRKIINCMRGRVVELATNCYGTHCLQKLLDCEEEIRLLIVSELLAGDPYETLLNKHASHVWSKIMELPWTPPGPPIFDYINTALSGKWVSLACHETGSLVVQHAFENLEPESKENIITELLHSESVFRDVVKNQWGSFCVSHLLELGSHHHRCAVIELLLANLLEYVTHEHGIKSVIKAVKEGNLDVRELFVKQLCLPPKGGRRACVVDIALSPIGSQLLTALLPLLTREQRNILYDALRPYVVTLRGSKTGSKAIWLFDRIRGNK